MSKVFAYVLLGVLVFVVAYQIVAFVRKCIALAKSRKAAKNVVSNESSELVDSQDKSNKEV